MNHTSTRLVREGDYVAEVGVTSLEGEEAWAPHLSLQDACKLDDVQDALRSGDIVRALRIANRVYRLTTAQG